MNVKRRWFSFAFADAKDALDENVTFSKKICNVEITILVLKSKQERK